MTDKQVVLQAILESMIIDDEAITARAIVRRSGGVFKHASDVTRNEDRRKLVKTYVGKQEQIRSSVGRATKKSRQELERQVASKNAEIQRLQDEKLLLIASHRAMILSVAELGGFTAWKRFFRDYQASLDSLADMGALPTADILAVGDR